MDEQKTEEATTSEAQKDAQAELEVLAGRYSLLDAQIAALDLERQDL